ncbi:MAG: hypothetical protein JRF02_01140 [Deltaproteobacteria bacterium]|nr:hypothetical protein [Deltaproteobacteria bacterium]
MFLIDKSDDEKDSLDALRSTLGLSVANHYSHAVVMNHTLSKFDDYNAENLEWVRDMEGEVYTTEQANADTNDLKYASLEEVGKMLREMDVIVPYGT